MGAAPHGSGFTGVYAETWHRSMANPKPPAIGTQKALLTGRSCRGQFDGGFIVEMGHFISLAT
jgi:hypothetical protein